MAQKLTKIQEGYTEALGLVGELNSKVMELQPKADVFDKVMEYVAGINVGESAKDVLPPVHPFPRHLGSI